MYRLNLPQYEIKIANKNGKHTIFDVLRRKYVALTPEEWVRQHFVHFLIEHKGYPSGLLANETELRIGNKHLRCDTVLYKNDLSPRIIIEYKAPSVQVTQKTFDQILTYNQLLHAEYIIVSNGISHFCCHINYDSHSYTFLNDIPNYEEL